MTGSSNSVSSRRRPRDSRCALARGARARLAARSRGQRGATLKVLLGAFGDPGHTFPQIALGRALVARGHDVTLQTWVKWKDDVLREGMRFEAAPEYDVFPTLGRYLKPYEAVVLATQDTRPLVAELRPDVVVSDILTLGPALAAELEGVPAVTLIPHVDPRPAPGFPPYSIGARLPRTAFGRAAWGVIEGRVHRGLLQGQAELNDTRARLGLPRLDHVHGGISQALVLVATFPQLEYPRPAASAPHTHAVGPLQWEPPHDANDIPEGDGPLVLVAPSTSQDKGHRLLTAALEGLGRLDGVRVLATWNRHPVEQPLPAPANAKVVEWVSYSRTMPHCDVVVCHAGHGTVMRALTSGCAVVAVPAAGDMNENAARIDWAGVGVRLPRRSATPRCIRLAVGRALDDPRYRRRAQDLADWAAAIDPAVRAAEILEDYVTS